MQLVENSEAFGEVVNIGGVEEISILRLAERIRDKVKSESRIALIPYEDVYPRDFEDMQRRVPSTEKLKRLIGYAPSMDLDKILEDVISYHRR